MKTKFLSAIALTLLFAGGGGAPAASAQTAEESPMVYLKYIDDMETLAGTAPVLEVRFTDRTKDIASVTSFGYELTLGDEKGSGIVDVPSSGEGYSASASGKECTFSLTLPVIPDAGAVEGFFSLTRINGREITKNRSNAECEFIINVREKGLDRRVVVEEYTGTWCPNCPKGWVAMEAMERIYGDGFIGLAFHYNDPMESDVEFPYNVKTYPLMFVNREESVTYSTVESEIAKAAKFGARASVDVSAEWTDASGVAVSVKSVSRFLDGASEGEYRLAYALIHDGMSGSTSSWRQQDNGKHPTDPYYPEWNSLTSYPTYNSVVINGSDLKGIEGSVQASDANTDVPHEYILDLKTHSRPKVQDKRRLSVVALLLDRDGNIVNAARSKIYADPSWPLDGELGENSGIQSVNTEENKDGEMRYFDLRGTEVNGNNLTPGIYVRRCCGVAEKVVIR